MPLRIELGPRDMEGGVAMLARRDTGAKESAPWGELAAKVPVLLEQIQVGARAGGRVARWLGGCWGQHRQGCPVAPAPMDRLRQARPCRVVALRPQWQVLQRARSHVAWRAGV